MQGKTNICLINAKLKSIDYVQITYVWRHSGINQDAFIFQDNAPICTIKIKNCFLRIIPSQEF